MASWMGWFGGQRDTKASTRDAIVTLRQLAILDKNEEDLQKKVDGEVRNAKAKAMSNKAGE